MGLWEQGLVNRLTKGGAVGHEDVDALGDLVPLIQQRLSSGEVEAPPVKPRGPAGTHGETKQVHLNTQTQHILN